MPRKTRLALVGERPATPDPDAMAEASYALDVAEREAHPLAAPDDIVAALRAQLRETATIASTAIDDANAARAREAEAVASIDQIRTSARAAAAAKDAEADKVRAEAAAAIAAAQHRERSAAASAVAAGIARQVSLGLAHTFAFLADRAPVLLTLIGAFVLARAMLPRPDAYQLAELAIYGGVAVLPAVWLSLRRG
jgi:hypothetical protein